MKKKKEIKDNNIKNAENESKEKENVKIKVKTEPGSASRVTINNSIPYLNVYKNGIMKVDKNKYSKSYKIPSVNFKTEKGESQDKIADNYSEFIGSFEPGVDIEVTLYNKTINVDDFKQKIFLEMKADNLNAYREEYNDMLVEKMKAAKNNLHTETILTVTVMANDIVEASDKFEQIDLMVDDNMIQITKLPAKPINIEERLELLNTIYNQDEALSLFAKRTIKGKKIQSFSLENCAKQGITTKDVIAPAGLSFDTNIVKVGDNVAKVYTITNWPTWLKGSVLSGFASLPTNSLISVYFNSIPQDEAIKLIKRQNVNIYSEIIQRQKKALNHSHDPELISPELSDSKREIGILMEQLQQDNGRLFVCNFVITLFAKDKKELDGYESQLKMIANKHLVTVRPLNYQQELGFNSSLPIGNKQFYGERLITSETVGALVPFDVKEINQDGGMYYGLHAMNHNMVLYNRKNDLNPNACIMGMPGAGKSFFSKREIVNVLLNTDDDIFVIDPEREYNPIADKLEGTVIKIANGSDTYINPFDMNLKNTGDDNDPVKVKSDFIITLCEIMVDGKLGLSSIEKSLIDRVVRKVYEPYVEYLMKTGKSYDTKHAPTMVEFYDELCQQPYPEAQNLALSIERYVSGSLDIFSHRTNIDINNRFIIYDIKNVGAGLKKLALQICLDNIFNKMIANFTQGKSTWFYIDEFYLMMKNPSSAEYIAEIWKRARKWNGIPCAITQNVEDMLKNEEARTVINNCSFIVMLSQSSINKQQLSMMLDITPAEQKYISSAKAGVGLLRIQEENIPIDDNFPKDTELYKIMTTKADERIMS